VTDSCHHGDNQGEKSHRIVAKIEAAKKQIELLEAELEAPI